jgi:2-isopropylmalate synthase
MVHVQGTINGFGERCGNANLCSIIPALKLKMGKRVRQRRTAAHACGRSPAPSTNWPIWFPTSTRPYVGNSAFAHKGGVHVSAIQRHPETYEHIRPELVGNVTRVLVSDLSGRSNILAKAEQFNINLDSKDPVTLEILESIKEMENKGYQFEGAEASFELLMRRALGTLRNFFSVIGFRVIDTKRHEDEMPSSEATVQVKVGGKIEHTAAEGNGPVNALDHALRKALEQFYPQLKEMKLLDYKVRVLPAGKGTASVTRVLIESGDKHEPLGDGRGLGQYHRCLLSGAWSMPGCSTSLIKDQDPALVVLGIPLHPDRMSRADWIALPGIGEQLATRIEVDRQKYGEFGRLEALERVKGIGPAKLQALRPYFVAGDK